LEKKGLLPDFKQNAVRSLLGRKKVYFSRPRGRELSIGKKEEKKATRFIAFEKSDAIGKAIFPPIRRKEEKKNFESEKKTLTPREEDRENCLSLVRKRNRKNPSLSTKNRERLFRNMEASPAKKA